MKIVREYINEKFTEEGDPIHDMDIGHPLYKFKYLLNTIGIKKLELKIFSAFNRYKLNDDHEYNLVGYLNKDPIDEKILENELEKLEKLYGYTDVSFVNIGTYASNISPYLLIYFYDGEKKAMKFLKDFNKITLNKI